VSIFKLVKTVEQAAEISGVHAAFAGDLFEGAEIFEMILNELAAALPGGKGQGVGMFEGGAGLQQLGAQAGEQLAAQFGGLTGAPLAVADEFIEERLDFGGRIHLGNMAGGEPAMLEPLDGIRAGKIHEVFDQRLLGDGGDVLPHAGAVAEEDAGMQFVAAAAQLQPAFAAGHVFQGIKGKSLAEDFIAGRAVLHAAANHGELGARRRAEVQVKTAGLGDLRGDMSLSKVDIPKRKRQARIETN
jgi:hypothetical protein